MTTSPLTSSSIPASHSHVPAIRPASIQSAQSTPSALAQVKATVIALTPRCTDMGDRIYAVFRTPEGRTLGFWSQANHPVLETLSVGDTVMLHRKANGHLALAPQRPQSRNPFALIQRFFAP